jgi:hypothetical protein
MHYFRRILTNIKLTQRAVSRRILNRDIITTKNSGRCCFDATATEGHMQNRSTGHSEASASVSDAALMHTAADYSSAFLEAIPFPLAAVDLELHLIGFNKAFRMKCATLCSREPQLHDEIQTLPFVVDRGPLAGEPLSTLCRRALKDGAFQISGHYAGTTASQKARLGFTPVYDPSGSPLMLTISMQDWVTRSKDRRAPRITRDFAVISEPSV